MSVNKAFVVKNSFEVSNDLILANAVIRKVGIAITNPQYTLDVAGGIGTTDFYLTGTGNLNNLVVDGTISAGSTTGTEYQYLASVGTGVTWRTFASPRISIVYSAESGDTEFLATYEIGLIDVYVNGVRLVPPPSGLAEFVASNGSAVYLNDPCFGGEIVELVVYNQPQ